jgi:opacity protein-like surface antigen
VKKVLLALAIAATAATAISAPAQAQEKTYVGPAVSSFGVGAIGRFSVSENVSIRPFAEYSTFYGGSGLGFGAAATYDFKLQDSKFVPYIGAGYAAGSISVGSGIFSSSVNYGGVFITTGVDYQISDSMTLNASYGSTLGGARLGLGFDF